MAIIYSYPINTNILATDTIVGSSTVIVNGRPKNQTKSFEIQYLAAYFASVIVPPGSYVPYIGAVSSVNLGIHNLTATSLIKNGGTSGQFLKADGSVDPSAYIVLGSLSASSPLTYNNTTGAFNISQSGAGAAGYLSSIDWNTFNNKQGALTLTTTGTGAATFVANVLNIPTPPVSTGVTSVTGTSPIISSGGTAPAISIPLGTSLVDGYLSAIDRTNFETAYINRITSLTTTGTGAATLVANVLNIPVTSLPVGFVPYIGATQAVDLGAFDLTVNGLTVGRGANSLSSTNTAIGNLALSSTTTGLGNTAIGFNALLAITTGNSNTALGYNCLKSVTTGEFNIGIGISAGLGITTGQRNNFIGLVSGAATTTGYGNNFLGDFTARFNTTGSYNVAIGSVAGFYFNTGDGNVALGAGSGYNNGIGSKSIFIGQAAGQVTSTNAYASNINNSILIGYNTKPFSTPSTNQIVIGDTAVGIGDNTVTLGNTSIITTRLRGAVQGGSFVKDSGTATQFLMADGSVSTAPSLTGFVPYIGATQAVDLGAFNLLVNSISVGKGAGTGIGNTVVGAQSLTSNTVGYYNVAFGYQSLTNNTSGEYNTAIGRAALSVNTTGVYNVAVGADSLGSLSSGTDNTVVGTFAMNGTQTGSQNVAIGVGAGRYYGATFSNNLVCNASVFIGQNAYPLLGSQINQIVIGVGAIGAGSNTATLGNTSITTTRLRGAVQGGSFVKDTGTVYETLLANGSVSTNGTLYKATSTAYQLVSGTSYFYSAVIPSNIFASGDNLKINTITATTTTSTAVVIMRYYINTTPSIVGATQIANWSGNAGSISYPMDRVYWVNGSDFYARNFTSSSPSSSNTGTTAINNTPIPGGSFYIIVEIITTAPDLAGLLNFQIIKS